MTEEEIYEFICREYKRNRIFRKIYDMVNRRIYVSYDIIKGEEVVFASKYAIFHLALLEIFLKAKFCIVKMMSRCRI